MDDAVVETCTKLYPRLVRVLHLYTGDPLAAEDLAQDTLVKVVDRWRHVSTLDNPEAWAFRVAINQARSRWRRLRVEARHIPVLVAPDVATGPDPTDVVALRMAILRLPARQRLAVTLRYLSDLPVVDVAKAMRCQPGTVTALTHQAVSALRLELTDLSEEATR